MLPAVNLLPMGSRRMSKVIPAQFAAVEIEFVVVGTEDHAGFGPTRMRAAVVGGAVGAECGWIIGPPLQSLVF